MAKVIAIVNQKGGVGKTTTAINLSAALALADKRVLLIDLDPQGNATSGLGIDKSLILDANVYHALVGIKTLSKIIVKSELDELDLAPSTADLSGAEIELVSVFSRENKLKAAIHEVKNQYDYILIDSPPSLGLLTINALTAADSYLVPLQCEYFALEGLSQLLNTVGLIKESTNPALVNDGIVLTMFNSTNNLSYAIENDVRSHFGNLVYETVIPRNVKLSECSSHGKPILFYDPNSKGCAAYVSLANEFLKRDQIISTSTSSANVNIGSMNVSI